MAANLFSFTDDLWLLHPSLVFSPRLRLIAIVVLGLNFVWVVGCVFGKVCGNETHMRKHAKYYEFWRAQHKANVGGGMSWRRRTWQQVKQQHKLLRIFFPKFEVGQDPKMIHTGAQKVTIVVSIILLKLLATALFYSQGCRADCVFANGIVPDVPAQKCIDMGGISQQPEVIDLEGGVGMQEQKVSGAEDPSWWGRRLLVALFASILCLPATVALDLLFWKQQAITNKADFANGWLESELALCTRAALHSALHS